MQPSSKVRRYLGLAGVAERLSPACFWKERSSGAIPWEAEGERTKGSVGGDVFWALRRGRETDGGKKWGNVVGEREFFVHLRRFT